MLRWLTVWFVVALLVLVTAPAGIGRIAAERQQFLVDELSRTLPGTTLVTESVETGWLTSRLRHRLIVTDDRLLALAADLVAEPGHAEPTAIVIDSVVAHGPWPLLERRPGLARIRSRLFWPGPDGTVIELPGAAITDVGFTGSGRTTLSLSGLRQPLPGARGVVSIDSLFATIDFSRHLSSIGSYLTLQGAKLVSPRGAIEADDVELRGDTHRSPERLWLGESTISLERFVLTDTLGETLEADGVRLRTAARSEDGLLEHSTRIGITALATPRWTGRAVSLEAHIGRLGAAALGRLLRGLRQQSTPLVEPDVFRELVRAGPTVDIRGLVTSGDAGELRLSLQVEVPPDQAGLVRDAADLLGYSEGTGRLSLDETFLAEMLAPRAPDQALGADPYDLVSMGFLRPVDGVFLAEFRIGGGLITINGMPLPIRP